MNKDTLAGLALVALAVAYWFAAGAIPHSVLAGQVSADGLPKLLAWMLGGLGLLLAVQGLIRRPRPAGAAATAPQDADEGTPWWAHLRALGMFAIAAAYILLVPYLGYILSIVLLGAAVLKGLRVRRDLGPLAAAVAGSALSTLAARRVLDRRALDAPLWPFALYRAALAASVWRHG